MNDLEERLRAVELAEPPLGFDPDEVVARAAKQQKSRRTVVAAGAAVLMIAGIVAGVSVGRGEAPAVPARPGPVVGNDAAMTARLAIGERNREHLETVLPGLLPAARHVTVDKFSATTGEDHPDEIYTMVTFVDAQDQRHTFSFAVLGPVTARRGVVPLDKLCVVPPPIPLHCGKLAQPDGSTVVVQDFPMKAAVPGGAVPPGVGGRDAIQFRRDGQAVAVSDQENPAGPSMTQEQLLALVTDPAFSTY